MQILPETYSMMKIDNVPTKYTVKIQFGTSRSWKLKMIKLDNQLAFSDGWLRIVQDLQLKRGHHLLFNPLHDSTFILTIFHYEYVHNVVDYPSGLLISLPKDNEVEVGKSFGQIMKSTKDNEIQV